MNRFPVYATTILRMLEANSLATAPCCRAANAAAEFLVDAGLQHLPSWQALADGARPAPPPDPAEDAGDWWQHGWQFHAANTLEQQDLNSTLAVLHVRDDAGPLAGPARLRSS